LDQCLYHHLPRLLNCWPTWFYNTIRHPACFSTTLRMPRDIAVSSQTHAPTTRIGALTYHTSLNAGMRLAGSALRSLPHYERQHDARAAPRSRTDLLLVDGIFRCCRGRCAWRALRGLGLTQHTTPRTAHAANAQGRTALTTHTRHHARHRG